MSLWTSIDRYTSSLDQLEDVSGENPRLTRAITEYRESHERLCNTLGRRERQLVLMKQRNISSSIHEPRNTT